MIRRPFKATKMWPVTGMGLALVLMATGCGGGAGGQAASSSEPTPTLSTFPESARIDLEEPTFSDPTNITNPLFPINHTEQVIQVGSDKEGTLRQEITLLPEIKTIEWNGQQVDTVVSQFMAYSAGRILEVARDFFAQADDGAVWYFGEDVTVYANGVVDNHDGTWLAGKDGPPGMIMPADPQVGDVYRPENIPGLVFEEVIVKSIDDTVDSAQGPITGCTRIEEHPMDGAIEDKTFAPGYGEFHAVVESENEVVTVSEAIPSDALPGSVPAEVTTLLTGASDLVAPIQDWSAAEASLASMTSAWDAIKGGTGLPPLTVDGLEQALQDLSAAVTAQDEVATQRAAVDLAWAASDLALLHEDAAAADLTRMDLLARRVSIDAEGSDAGPVAGDFNALQAIWVRVMHTVSDPAAVDAALEAMSTAVDTGDQAGATAAADELRTALAQL